MPGAMPVIEALLPEELSSESIESEARGAFRENGSIKGYYAFEDKGVGFAFHLCWFAEVDSSCGVCRAIQVLGAGVA